jgi:hypothetical protein
VAFGTLAGAAFGTLAGVAFFTLAAAGLAFGTLAAAGVAALTALAVDVTFEIRLRWTGFLAVLTRAFLHAHRALGFAMRLFFWVA